MRRLRFYREAFTRSCVRALSWLWLYGVRRYREGDYVTTRLDRAMLDARAWADGWHHTSWPLPKVLREGWRARGIPKSRRDG